jgi:cellulose synthase/poly-beta-1,6-N-acetylglucosamine synthase-like glycosyltransferase
MPSLALITVLYKCDEVLEDFFSGISKQDFKDYKLYLIDNSANDATTALIQRLQQQYPVTSVEHIDTGGKILELLRVIMLELNVHWKMIANIYSF